MIDFLESSSAKLSQTFVFPDERMDSIDNGFFATVFEGIDPVDPNLTRWWELPANYHNGKIPRGHIFDFDNPE